MLNQNDMRIGSFYSLNNLNIRIWDIGEIAYFHLKKDIIGRDFYKFEGIPFNSEWKKKIFSDCVLDIEKYSSRKFVHEVQRDYFNDFGEELQFNIKFDEDKILD